MDFQSVCWNISKTDPAIQKSAIHYKNNEVHLLYSKFTFDFLFLDFANLVFGVVYVQRAINIANLNGFEFGLLDYFKMELDFNNMFSLRKSNQSLKKY